MENNRTDVIIIGGGLVGLAQGIALAQAGISIVAIDREAMAAQLLPEFDGRTCALSLASVRLMQNIGAWDEMQPHAEPILDILVQDNKSPSFVHYDHADVGSDPMGVIIENRYIRRALQLRAAEVTNLTVIAPMSWQKIDNGADSVRVTLQDGREIAAQLLLAADSRYSQVREAIGIGALSMDYGQTAIVATIGHEQPHQGLAMEKFFPQGPFASLPLTGNRSSLVWVESTKTAAAMVKLPTAEIEAQIQQRMGDMFGKISLQGGVFTYPLHFVLTKEYHKGRVMLVGDAAHGMHPVAGQGVNLGYRDVAELTEILLQAARIGQDLGSLYVREQYARSRRMDSLAMLGVTDGIVRLFSNNNPLLKLARNLGLAGVQQLPPLKSLFMRHAMGVLGELPPLMQKNAA